MDSIRECLVTVPASLVRQSCGLGIDMGGSVFKVVYRSKENIRQLDERSNFAFDQQAWPRLLIKNLPKNLPKNSQNGFIVSRQILDTSIERVKSIYTRQKLTDGMGNLTVLSVAAEQMKEAVDYIESRISIDKNQNNPIYCTGMGRNAFRKYLSEKLNVRLCCIDKEAAELPNFKMEKMINLMRMMTENGFIATPGKIQNGVNGHSHETECNGTGKDLSNLSLTELNKDMYPCILAMFGSGTGFFQVNADGSHMIIDGTVMAGKNFLSLGCLLTGAKTFEELIELASKGDDRNIHIYGEDLYQSFSSAEEQEQESDSNGHIEGETDLYRMFENMEGVLIYGFGKCIGKQLHELNKADVAKALLVQIILNQIQILAMTCSARKLYRVFFCGSFFNSALIRSITTTELTYRNMVAVPIKQLEKPIEFEFLKMGSHLGAIGTLLVQQEKYGKM